MSQRICSVPGCEKRWFSREWCQMHYKHWKTHGYPGEVDPTCPILDCGKPIRYNGMCQSHANNLVRYGYAIPVRDWPLIARLVHVGWDETDRGCWEWRGKRSEKGYGLINAHRLDAVGARVHRLMWEMHNGPIPDGLVVRHRCDNPPCVNPDHLEVGTVAENQRDMAERGRSIAYRTGRYGGVCIKGLHDVTQPGALLATKSGDKSYLRCAECDRERKRKYQAKKKAERLAARKKAA